jgi:predicted GNAT family N-acyltransferase
VIAATDDLATCRTLRRAVFVEEQGVAPEIEFDRRDGEAVHFLAHDGVPAGTARMTVEAGDGKIGHLCVLAAHRGRGLGVGLLEACMTEARRLGLARVRLTAQRSAVEFYKRLGFSGDGPERLIGGRPHFDMARPL